MTTGSIYRSIATVSTTEKAIEKQQRSSASQHIGNERTWQKI